MHLFSFNMQSRRLNKKKQNHFVESNKKRTFAKSCMQLCSLLNQLQHAVSFVFDNTFYLAIDNAGR